MDGTQTAEPFDVEATLRKLKCLIALTASPNAHEASNAALHAIRLITKYNLGIVAAANQGHVHCDFRSTAEQEPERSTPKGPVRMRAKYAGRCMVCKIRFFVGEQIVWFPSVGAVHSVCEGARSHSNHRGQKGYRAGY